MNFTFVFSISAHSELRDGTIAFASPAWNYYLF